MSPINIHRIKKKTKKISIEIKYPKINNFLDILSSFLLSLLNSKRVKTTIEPKAIIKSIIRMAANKAIPAKRELVLFSL